LSEATLLEQPSTDVATEPSNVTPILGDAESLPASTELPDSTPETPAPVVKDAAYFTGLQSQLDSGEPLTTEQRSDLGRHHQSERDRAAAATAARQQAVAAQESMRQKVVGLGPALKDAISKRLALDPTDPALELIGHDADTHISGLLQDITPIVHIPLIASFKEGIANLKGQSAETVSLLDSLEGADLLTTIDAFNKALWQKAQASSPNGKKVAELEAEVTRLKAELLTVDGQLKGKGSPSSNGRNAESGRSDEELMLDDTTDFATRLAIQARRTAALMGGG
jgi:hypothetical protein